MSDDAPFHNPFGALSRLRDSLPERPVAPAPAAPPARAAKATGPARAVVRMERSGRGGKEVTVIEHLGLPPLEREKWVKALKASLGCGGLVEGDSLVLQGDQRKRVPALLTARGVRKIVIG
ncbi:MAG: translation initiation factor [Acidobacteriota bacterium]